MKNKMSENLENVEKNSEHKYVWVDSYSIIRNGKHIHIDGHWRFLKVNYCSKIRYTLSLL